MARYFDVYPASPQPRVIVQIGEIVRAGGVIAYPTDSCYAPGCQLGNRDGMTRIRSIRGLDGRHHLTLVCQGFAQLGQLSALIHLPDPEPQAAVGVLPARTRMRQELRRRASPWHASGLGPGPTGP
jgi:tRNA A37 threonylcarbamoyladenosine synthetase subunit TsaC/SUA5/YrdC